MQAFLAMIVPMGDTSGAHPDHTLPVPPPRWDTFPKPQPPGQPPIAGWPGGLPGGGGFPGQGGPVDPGYGVDTGHRPSHPIYFPPEGQEPPLGIWGPPQMPPGYRGGGSGRR